MKRRTGFILSMIVFFLATGLLLSGSPLLEKTLIGSLYLPLGNIITWLGMIAFPLVFLFGFRAICHPKTKIDKFFRFLFLIALFLSALWGFISFYLAGNWSYSFTIEEEFRGSVEASKIFWINSYLTGALPLVLISLYGMAKLISTIKIKFPKN